MFYKQLWENLSINDPYLHRIWQTANDTTVYFMFNCPSKYAAYSLPCYYWKLGE